MAKKTKASIDMILSKKAMLEALEKSLGIATTACKMVGISRTTHYNWVNDDPEYKKAVADLENIVLDFAESALHKQVKNGNPTSTILTYSFNEGNGSMKMEILDRAVVCGG